jgi:quercetin dioxygenase-like cupin family protein
MPTMTMSEFTKQSLEEGFDEVLVREWQANQHLATHTHAFDASVLVIKGSYSLTVGDKVRHLRAGDSFRLARNIAHAETYGPEGATIWVARAN